MSRPPKPTELKLLEGNRGKRALSKGEPQPDFLNELAPPAWLPADAAAVWSELAFRLRASKVLTVLDVTALEKMCVAIATYRRATLAASGMELIEKSGETAGEKGKSEKARRPIGFVGMAKGGDVPQGDAAEDVQKGDAKLPVASAPASGATLNPWMIVQSMAFKQATALMREFGMTPAARSRVLIDPNFGLFGNGDGQEKSKTYFT